MSIFPENVMYLPFLDNKCAPPGPLRRIFLCCIKEILQSLLLDNKISLQELASIQYTASFDARKTYRTRDCTLHFTVVHTVRMLREQNHFIWTLIHTVFVLWWHKSQWDTDAWGLALIRLLPVDCLTVQ